MVNYRKRREERHKALLHQETKNEENENENENENEENDKKSITDIPIVLKTDVEGSIQVY